MKKKPVEKRNKQEPVRSILNTHENMFMELKDLIIKNQSRNEILFGELRHQIQLVAEGVLMNSEKIDRVREDVSDLKKDMKTVKADIVFMKSDISEIKRTYVRKKELRSIT